MEDILGKKDEELGLIVVFLACRKETSLFLKRTHVVTNGQNRRKGKIESGYIFLKSCRNL